MVTCNDNIQASLNSIILSNSSNADYFSCNKDNNSKEFYVLSMFYEMKQHVCYSVNPEKKLSLESTTMTTFMEIQESIDQIDV